MSAAVANRMPAGVGVNPSWARIGPTLRTASPLVRRLTSNTLGIGLSHAAISEGMWGIPWNQPMRRLNEYLDCLLPLLTTGEVDA